MSFKDLRNFTEMMRALGYPRLISMENFRSPNFPLVAEILTWLVKRFEPNADLPTDVDTEQDRVIFIRSVSQFMASKAYIRLNTKKLYQADGYAVKELLKVTSVLYNAMKINMSGNSEQQEEEEEGSVLPTVTVSSKINELKQTRQLATQITTKGAGLYDLLGREIELRKTRSSVVARQLEINEVEAGLRDSIKAVELEIQKTNSLIENVASNEANLETKIEKKKVELERNQKRLQTLKKVRPAFMDEYEKLELELKKCYEDYMCKFRCLAYLEQQLEEYERTEQERMEERQAATKKLLERMKQDESLRSLEGSGGLLSDGEYNDSDEGDTSPDLGEKEQKPKKPKPGAVNRPGPAARRVFGSMTGVDEDSESLGSDSDLILDGEGDEGSELGSDEELEVASIATRKNNSKQPSQNPAHSDDDF